MQIIQQQQHNNTKPAITEINETMAVVPVQFRQVKLNLFRTNMVGNVLLDINEKGNFLFRRTACVVSSTIWNGLVHLSSNHSLLLAFRRTHSGVFGIPGSLVTASSGSARWEKTKRVTFSLIKIKLRRQKWCRTCQEIICSWFREGNTPLELKGGESCPGADTASHWQQGYRQTQILPILLFSV